MKIKWALFVFFAILVISSQQAFAVVATFQVVGKVVDSQNKFLPGAVISFEDANGKKVVGGITNQEGSYNLLVPQGTYTVVVDPPQGVTAPQVSTSGQIISSNTNRDFTLATPIVSMGTPKATSENTKPISSPMKLLIVVVVLLVIVIIVAYYFVTKNKKNNGNPSEGVIS